MLDVSFETRRRSRRRRKVKKSFLRKTKIEKKKKVMIRSKDIFFIEIFSKG